MRKKGLLIQSAVIIAVSVMALTVITFAWFAPPWARIDEFQVQVVGLPKINYDFYRDYEDGKGYVKVEAGHSFVDEIMFPGKSVYSRIDIANVGDRDAFVSVAFTGITYRLENDVLTEQQKLDIIKDGIQPHLKIFVFDLDYGEVIPSDPTEQEILMLEQVGVPLNNDEMRLASRLNIISGASKSIYYRFHLDMATEAVDGAFDIHAAGIKFFAS